MHSGDPTHTATALLEADPSAPVDVEVLSALLQHIRDHPPTTIEERDEWLELVGRLRDRVRGELKEVGRQLRQTTQNRRGIRGYAAVKSTRGAQHANKVV